MADRPNYTLDEDPVYTEEVPEILDSDKVRASQVVNPLITTILNNQRAIFLLSGVENVKSFGAKGDGTTDDTVTIQNAINAMKADSALYFPSGDYLISGLYVNTTQIRKRGLTFFGDGESSKLILKDSSNTDVLIIDNCPNFTVSSIGVEGNKSKNQKGNGIEVRRSEFSIIDKVFVKNCAGHGINVEAVMNGASFAGNDELHITNSYIQSCGGNGVTSDSVSDLTIISDNIEFNSGNGLDFSATVGGPGAYPGGNIIISNNHILSNDGRGINVSNGTSRVSITNNQIRNNGTYGIYANTGHELSVLGNNIHVNGEKTACEAVTLAYTNHCRINDNLICCTDFNKTQTYAFWLSNATDIDISHNIMYNNSNEGIHADGTNSYQAYGNVGLEDTNGGYIRQSTAPQSTSLLWMDSGHGDIMKYYNGTAWVPQPSVWG